MLDAIGTLTAYSFIAKRPDGKFYDIHRLVHLATRSWLESKGLLAHWSREVVARLANILPEDEDYIPMGEYLGPDVPEDSYGPMGMWESCFSHTRFALEHIAAVKLDEASALLVQKFCNNMTGQLNYDEAEVMYIHLLEVGRKLWGQEHSLTLKMVANLAALYWLQDRWMKAEELDLQVLSTRERELGR